MSFLELFTNESTKMIFGFVAIIILLAIIALKFVSLWIIYVKADRKGWECLIPIYNTLILLKIVGKPWWWIFLFIIPGIDLIFVIWMFNMLSKSFGKSKGFTVGLVFLTIVFLPILAFSDAKYLGPYGDREAFEDYKKKLATES